MTLRYEDPTEGAPIEEPLFNEPASTPGEEFFAVASKAAVPVAQRAAEDYGARSVSFIEPYRVANRRVGRRSITLSCPTSFTPFTSPNTPVTPLGFVFSNDRTNVETGVGFQVNPGDSVTIESEAPVWVAPLPGNASGMCQYVEDYDSPGGSVAS